MLRITVTEDALKQKWVVEGRLTEGSAADLISSWRASRDRSSRTCIVDLNNVTSIDRRGEEVLLMMMRDGATFVATGVYTRHLLQALRERIAKCANPE